MEFIPPPEIAAKIMTLFDDTDVSLCIVSPYNNWAKWSKLKKHLSSVIKRVPSVKYFIRDDKNIDFKPFEDVGIQPILVKDLHAKIYKNEKYAIVSSMNLIEYSDINSIDFAYKTETPEEYSEIYRFIEKYIDIKSASPSSTENNEPLLRTEIEVLLKTFRKMYPGAKINDGKTYLFSKDILPGFELMINHTVTIKRKIFNPKDKASFDEMYGNCYRIFSPTCKIHVNVNEEKYYACIQPNESIYNYDRVGSIVSIVNDIPNKIANSVRMEDI